LRLTPDILVSTYDMLRTCAPFRRWKLLHSDDVVFEVTHRKHEFGEYQDIPPKISVSANNKTMDELVRTMAHEMVHHYLHQKGFRSWHKHGALFNRAASLVCRKLGFDPATF